MEGILLSSDVGPNETSPIKGATRAERAASRRQKMLKHRAQAQAHDLSEADLVQATQYEEILAHMAEKGIRFGNLLNYVFNPENGQGTIYYHEFLI